MLCYRGSSQPRDKPRSLALQVDSLLSEPLGKPKNTEVGNPPLLQGNLPNPGIELGSPALQADSLLAELPVKPSHSQPLATIILKKAVVF